jgi:hexosaminidase
MDGIPQDEGAFPWRGFMLDISRHFWPITEIERLLNGMQYLKLNILHLHLSDDQGWRFESKKWPKLTTVGAWRSETVVGRPATYKNGDLYPESYLDEFDGVKHGGFYTQEELKRLVEYAKENGIVVVPEIDMPGHMRAARAAYPELGYDGKVLEVGRSWGVYWEVLRVDDIGLKFCTDILDEICEVFDSPYIHIGGDECPKREWLDSEVARRQLEEIGGKDMDVLQRWFTTQLGKHLKSKGRRLVGWDEVLDGGVPDGEPLVMAWRDWTKAAKRSTSLGVDTIQTPGALYFDHAQGPESGEPLSIGLGADLAAVYALDPFAGIDAANKHHIRGVQAQIWTEYVANVDHLWYMVFPRLVAVADVAYLGDKRPPYEEFLRDLPARLEQLKGFGLGHRPLESHSIA